MAVEINGGAFAEYVSVPQDLLALKPDNVTFEQAASVPTRLHRSAEPPRSE